MDHDKQLEKEEKPPVFSSWKKWYAVVSGFLVLLVILFYLFTRIFE